MPPTCSSLLCVASLFEAEHVTCKFTLTGVGLGERIREHLDHCSRQTAAHAKY